MTDVKLPDLSKVRGSDDKRELSPQASAEDTSNWDDRAIALPNPNVQFAIAIKAKDVLLDSNVLPEFKNPYLEQERLKSVKYKK